MDLENTTAHQQDQPNHVRREEQSDLNNLPSELLEHVLELLPIRDLLLSQCVCRKWRSLISNSPVLQQALFMRPAPGPFEGWKMTYTAPDGHSPRIKFEPVSDIKNISYGTVRTDDQLEAPLRSCIDYRGRDLVAWFLIEGDIYSGRGHVDATRNSRVEYAEKKYVSGMLNPLLFRSHERAKYDLDDENFPGFVAAASKFHLLDEPWGRDGQEYTENGLGWREFRLRLLRTDQTASWRRMYLSQPPVKRLWLEKYEIRSSILDSWEDVCYKAKESEALSPQPDEPAIRMEDLIHRIKWKREHRHVFGLEGILCPLPAHEGLLESAMMNVVEEHVPNLG